MFTSTNDARTTLFGGFDEFQKSFPILLAAYAKEKDTSKRSTLATRFAKDMAVTHLNSAKDGLLKNIVPPVLAVDTKLVKLLRVFGGREND